MNYKKILEEARQYSSELISIRRYLHENPEVGFELQNTKKFVSDKLKKIGCIPIECGKCGIITDFKKGDNYSTILLRADMDALPIKEKADIEFKSKNNNMHGCGHDMHTAMLLGCAKILKRHESEIKGNIRLMFQPAEEILEGSKDMIENGVLNNIDAAIMIHVMAGLNINTGTVIVSSPGIGAPSADYFEISVKGTGSHASMPNLGTDTITSASHIVTALQEINARELSLNEKALITIGTVNGGTSVNSISDKTVLNGIMRCYSSECRTRIKNRISEISKLTAEAFRTNAEVIFGSGCPELLNDKSMSEAMCKYMNELLGKELTVYVSNLDSDSSKASGSEDFAYISQKVPSIMLAIGAGNKKDGYINSQHHPEVVFDENALPTGSAVYAYSALRWLEDKEKD